MAKCQGTVISRRLRRRCSSEAGVSGYCEIHKPKSALPGRVVSVLANPLLMQAQRLEELEESFRWKAENNIRFYEKLDMTTEQKVDFLAQEFAAVYWLGEMHRLDWPVKEERIQTYEPRTISR